MRIFRQLTVRIPIRLHPSRLNDVKAGVLEQLQSLVWRYIPEANGVLLCYWNAKVLDRTARIYNHLEWLHFNVQADVLVFAPQVGDYVLCKVNKIGHDHIAGLVFGVFNTTVIADGVGGLLGRYNYNAEFEMWSAEEPSHTNQDMIELGTFVRLRIIGVHHGEMLFLSAAFDERDPSQTGAMAALPDSIKQTIKDEWDGTIPVQNIILDPARNAPPLSSDAMLNDASGGNEFAGVLAQDDDDDSDEEEELKGAPRAAVSVQSSAMDVDTDSSSSSDGDEEAGIPASPKEARKPKKGRKGKKEKKREKKKKKKKREKKEKRKKEGSKKKRSKRSKKDGKSFAAEESDSVMDNKKKKHKRRLSVDPSAEIQPSKKQKRK